MIKDGGDGREGEEGKMQKNRPGRARKGANQKEGESSQELLRGMAGRLGDIVSALKGRRGGPRG